MSKSDYSLNIAEQKVAKLVHDFMFAFGGIFVENLSFSAILLCTCTTYWFTGQLGEREGTFVRAYMREWLTLSRSPFFRGSPNLPDWFPSHLLWQTFPPSIALFCGGGATSHRGKEGSAQHADDRVPKKAKTVAIRAERAIFVTQIYAGTFNDKFFTTFTLM